MPKITTDLLIIGGGPAGLSAALFFSRVKRSCMIYDSGIYRNASSKSAHTILGFEGIDPAEWREKVRKEIKVGYPNTTMKQGVTITGLKRRSFGGFPTGFEAVDGDGNTVLARKVVMATGVRDVLPDIPGLTEAWGSRAIHCIYCHGTETANQPFAFLFTAANKAWNPMLAAGMFKLWPHLDHTEKYILTHGMDLNTKEGLEASGLEKVMPLIKARGYKIITSPISSITQSPSSLTINFHNHDPITIPYMLVFPEKMLPNIHASPLLTPEILGEGVTLSPMGTIPPPEPPLTTPGLPPRMGDDPRTNIPGLFWAGNSGSAMANVNVSVGQGQAAAGLAAEELGAEDLERDLAALTGAGL